ncbi:MAG: DUF4249 domain-containing protein [Bacteroidota bacterium]|nr:DUF4249 domain-containing protein [Bacteroidota bacterium]
MRNILIILFTFCLTIIISCEKTITVKQQPYQSKLSIQGLITPNQSPRIFINKTVPYFDPKVNARELTVDNANVTLNDGTSTFTLSFDSGYNYHYCHYDYFYSGLQNIRANTTYTLTIIFNGTTYSAQAITNQSMVAITSLSYVQKFKDLYGEHEGIIVGYNDKPGEENYYRYEMGRMIDSSVKSVDAVKSSCTFGEKYYVKEIGRTVYADKNVDGKSLTFTFEPNYSHKKSDSTHIKMESVDKNIFNFYDNFDRQKLAQYNPFVEPVFINPGQFTNAIGVFGAYAISDSVLFVYPE